MTLILAAATSSQVVVVTDRRTTAGGTVRSEEIGKLGLLLTDDARVAVTYTGLAEFGTFKTRFWIAETLGEIGNTRNDLDAVVAELHLRLAPMITSLRGLATEDAALTILLAGFRYSSGVAPTPCFARISNFEREVVDFDAPDERALLGVRPVTPDFSLVADSSPSGFTVGAGYAEGMTWDDVTELREKMSTGSDARSIRSFMVHLIRSIASRKSSRGVIGKQCSSLIVPSDPGTQVEMDHHTSVPTQTAYFPARYDLRGAVKGGGLMVWDASVTLGTPAQRATFVPVVAKKARCPCGTGLQYRRCHGRRGHGTGFVIGG